MELHAFALVAWFAVRSHEPLGQLRLGNYATRAAWFLDVFLPCLNSSALQRMAYVLLSCVDVRCLEGRDFFKDFNLEQHRQKCPLCRGTCECRNCQARGTPQGKGTSGRKAKQPEQQQEEEADKEAGGKGGTSARREGGEGQQGVGGGAEEGAPAGSGAAKKQRQWGRGRQQLQQELDGEGVQAADGGGGVQGKVRRGGNRAGRSACQVEQQLPERPRRVSAAHVQYAETNPSDYDDESDGAELVRKAKGDRTTPARAAKAAEAAREEWGGIAGVGGRKGTGMAGKRGRGGLQQGERQEVGEADAGGAAAPAPKKRRGRQPVKQEQEQQEEQQGEKEEHLQEAAAGEREQQEEQKEAGTGDPEQQQEGGGVGTAKKRGRHPRKQPVQQQQSEGEEGTEKAKAQQSQQQLQEAGRQAQQLEAGNALQKDEQGAAGAAGVEKRYARQPRKKQQQEEQQGGEEARTEEAMGQGKGGQRGKRQQQKQQQHKEEGEEKLQPGGENAEQGKGDAEWAASPGSRRSGRERKKSSRLADHQITSEDGFSADEEGSDGQKEGVGNAQGGAKQRKERGDTQVGATKGMGVKEREAAGPAAVGPSVQKTKVKGALTTAAAVPSGGGDVAGPSHAAAAANGGVGSGSSSGGGGRELLRGLPSGKGTTWVNTKDKNERKSVNLKDYKEGDWVGHYDRLYEGDWTDPAVEPVSDEEGGDIAICL